MNRPTESVWDYPRPPRIEPCTRRLQVFHEGRVLADTTGGHRVLETSHPPCYYLPPDAIDWQRLEPSPSVTFCEFKGPARYWSLRTARGLIADVCWSYPEPWADQRAIAGEVSFYAARVDTCLVDGERVQPQAGAFYGGWITADVTGPFKGGPGTLGW